MFAYGLFIEQFLTTKTLLYVFRFSTELIIDMMKSLFDVLSVTELSVGVELFLYKEVSRHSPEQPLIYVCIWLFC